MRLSLLLVPLAIAGLAATAWFALFADGTEPAPLDIDRGTISDPERRLSAGDSREVEVSNDRVAIDRLAMELGVPELAEDEAEDGSSLVVRGRVVTSDHVPVPATEITVRVRRNVRAFFENGAVATQQPDFDWQSVFRQRNLAKEVMTDKSGVFTIAGKTFARGAGVEIAAVHREFAPQVLSVDWEPSQGELSLPDIVLSAGAEVFGIVIGPSGAPVADAKVRLEPGNASTDNRGPGGPGGRGGPGGFARGQGRPDDTLRQLLGEAQTDAAGRFGFLHVPPGSVAVLATAPRHLDGRSPRSDIADGARLDLGSVQLGPGAEISGTVVDERGSPVVGATLSVSYVADTGDRGGQQGGGRRGNGQTPGGNGPGRPGSPGAEPATTDAGGSNGGRRGRNNSGDPRQIQGGPGGQNGPGAIFGGFGRGGNSNFSTKTDKQGQYRLDRVPAEELAVSVRHDSFVDTRFEPIDPRVQPHLDFRLVRRPAVIGMVVDAATGEPIEQFGIRWRRDPGSDIQRGFQQFGDRLQQADDPNADPMRAQMMQQMRDMATQFEQAVQRQEQQRQLLLGGSGQVAGTTPKPTSHGGGRFKLDDVEPGTFLLDVDAPGYIKLAAGPFTVASDVPPAEIAIRMERGGAVQGRLVSAGREEPVGGARITVSLPSVEDPGSQIGQMFGRGRGGRGGPGGMFRGGRDTVAQIRSASDGRFELPPLRPGRYSIEVRADGFPDYSSQDFIVSLNAPETVVRIESGAHLFGRVFGLESGSRATLELTHLDNRDRRTTRVDEKTGEYSIAGLAAGGWVIQLVGESQRGSFRQRLGALLGSVSSEAPDVVLQAGQELRHDVDASSAMPGVVQGYVIRNGQPGSGLEVRLAEAEAANSDPNAATSPQQMFARFGRGGALRGSVDSNDGSFRIDSVPSGSYTLEVHERAGRGGAGGPRARNDRPLYSVAIDIRRGQTLAQTIQVSTGTLSTALRRKDNQEIGRVSIQLVRTAEGGQLPPDQWRNLPSFRQLTSRGGEGTLGELPADSYSYTVNVNGMKPVTGQIFMSPGGTTRLEGELEAADPGEAGAAPQQPSGGAASPASGNRRGGQNPQTGNPGGNGPNQPGGARGRGGRGQQQNGGGAPGRGGF